MCPLRRSLFLSANSSSEGFRSGLRLGSSFFMVLGLLLRSWGRRGKGWQTLDPVCRHGRGGEGSQNTPAPAPHALTSSGTGSDGPPPPGPAGPGPPGPRPRRRSGQWCREEGSWLTPAQGATCASHSGADPLLQPTRKTGGNYF